MTGVTATPQLSGVERGAARWTRSFRVMILHDLVTLRLEVTVMIVFQLLMGAGAALIYGFVLGDLDPTRTVFVTTGAPVLAMVPVGLTFLPGTIANMKAEGSYDYAWSLPVPRTAAVAATVAVFTTAALPGATLALVVAAWRYDVSLAVSPSVILALALTSLMAASVGYAVGHVVDEPQVTNLITNLIIFVVLMFSPIGFPIDQFPSWLAAVHQVLPFHHMATAVRGGLTDGIVTDLTRAYLVLGLWTVASWAAALRVVARRS